jgi:hypothetical protein
LYSGFFFLYLFPNSLSFSLCSSFSFPFWFGKIFSGSLNVSMKEVVLFGILDKETKKKNWEYKTMSKRRNRRENWVTYYSTSSVKVHLNDNNNNSKKGEDRYVSWLISVENILFSSSCMLHRFRCRTNNNDSSAVILSIGIMSNFLFEFLSVSL